MTPQWNLHRAALMGGVAAVVLCTGLLPAGIAAASESRGGGPEVSLTSAVGGDAVAPGVGRPGAGSATDGSGFVITIEAQTHDRTGIAADEELNIRNTALLGQPNPHFPGLVVTVDNTLTKPDGTTIPAGTNLANLFNIAGTDDSRGPGVTVWAGWHVLESLAPGTTRLTVTAHVTDLAGRTGTDVQTYRVSAAGGSGQELTPPPGPVPDPAKGTGPELEFAAPERPTAVATGTLPQPVLSNGTLFFIQLDALDVAHHGIGVSENGVAGAGVIVDPTQIAVNGPNRNAPGLTFTFDAALRQPNGNLVPAGQNLAPLFNIAGSAVGPHKAVRTTFDWVVGGSLVLPPGHHTLTMTATVTDNAGAHSTARQTVEISPVVTGQALTPQP